MSSDIAVEFQNVWKKYSREAIFHKSLREDFSRLFRPASKRDGLNQGEFWALKDINFEVSKGETVGFYGHNGAGKTTILKLIAGVTYPTQGNLQVHGRVAPILEIGAGFHPDLAGRENIFMNGAILGMKIKEIQQKLPAIIEFAEIDEAINMPVKKYSSGMYMRLAFAIAVHCEVDIYLIDEVFAVGDSIFKKKCQQKLCSLKDAGKSILFVSHDKLLIEKISDRIITMDQGQIEGINQLNRT